MGLASVLPRSSCVKPRAFAGPSWPFCGCIPYQGQEVIEPPGMCPRWICIPFFYTVLQVPKVPHFPARTPSGSLPKACTSSLTYIFYLLQGWCAADMLTPRTGGWSRASCVGRLVDRTEVSMWVRPLWDGTEPGVWGEVGHSLWATDRGQAGSPWDFTFCWKTSSCLRVLNSNLDSQIINKVHSSR